MVVTLDRMFTHYDKTLKVLPRFIARIRTGNDEELRFLADLDAKVGFMESQNLEFEDSSTNTLQREIERNGVSFTQRFDIYEVFESNELEKLFQKVANLGLDVSFFLPMKP